MVTTLTAPVLALDVATYQRHPLHDDERDWPETNCYIDAWVELLHALGLEPRAALAFTVACDFDGEQWEFFKCPLEDLYELYGIRVREVNLWRPLAEHTEMHLQLGHLLTLEADSWYLPDTAGSSYRINHQKTTIVTVRIDRDRRYLEYFHNRGYHRLADDDYDGVLRVAASPPALAPYAESITLDRMRALDEATLRDVARALLVRHLGRRPTTNPVKRLGARISTDVAWLTQGDEERFHGYAFGTLRQCGAWAQSAAAFVRWLDPTSRVAADAFDRLSNEAKICQFLLARAAAGRGAQLTPRLDALAGHWDTACAALVDQYG